MDAHAARRNLWLTNLISRSRRAPMQGWQERVTTMFSEATMANPMEAMRMQSTRSNQCEAELIAATTVRPLGAAARTEHTITAPTNPAPLPGRQQPSRGQGGQAGALVPT